MTPQKLKIHVRFNKRKKYKVSGKEKETKQTMNPNKLGMTKQRDAARPRGLCPPHRSPRCLQTTPTCTPGAATSARHGPPSETHKTQFNLESRQHIGQ